MSMNVDYYNEFVSPDNGLAAVVVWFRNASGGNSYINLTLLWPGLMTPDVWFGYIMQTRTMFVRQNWFLIEVTTAQFRDYGQLRGGEGVLRLTRALP